MSHAVQTPKPRELGRRAQLLIIGGVGLALAVSLGAAHLLGDKSAPRRPAALPAGAFQATSEERANITVEPVETRSFADQIVAEGKLALDDERTTQVFAPFSGRVTRVFVTAGQAVRRGEPLVGFAANELIQAQLDLANAAAAERQAKAQLAQARANYERQTALLAADAAAQRDVQQARTDLAAAEQALTAATAAKAAAVGRAAVLNLQPGRLTPSRRAAPPEARLVSPITGVVVMRQVGDGQFVNSVAGGAGQPLLTVSDTSRLWLVAELRDSDAAQVRPGAPIQARIAALNGHVVSGRVGYVAPAVDAASRRVVVRAEIPNPDGLLRPEMFAETAVATGPARTALAVPQSAVIYDGPKARVWLAEPNGVFILREVTLGATQDGFVEVRAGLSPNARIAVAGALFLDEAGKGDE